MSWKACPPARSKDYHKVGEDLEGQDIAVQPLLIGAFEVMRSSRRLGTL